VVAPIADARLVGRKPGHPAYVAYREGRTVHPYGPLGRIRTVRKLWARPIQTWDRGAGATPGGYVIGDEVTHSLGREVARHVHRTVEPFGDLVEQLLYRCLFRLCPLLGGGRSACSRRGCGWSLFFPLLLHLLQLGFDRVQLLLQGFELRFQVAGIVRVRRTYSRERKRRDEGQRDPLARLAVHHGLFPLCFGTNFSAPERSTGSDHPQK